MRDAGRRMKDFIRRLYVGSQLRYIIQRYGGKQKYINVMDEDLKAKTLSVKRQITHWSPVCTHTRVSDGALACEGDSGVGGS